MAVCLVLPVTTEYLHAYALQRYTKFESWMICKKKIIITFSTRASHSKTELEILLYL